MEQTTDSLFQLIHSLTKAEKRYFKLFSGKDARQFKTYIALFDIISGMKRYDKKALSQKMKERNLQTDTLKTRQYLFDGIIKSLIFYYAENDTEFKTRLQLLQLLVLNKKELFLLAQKKLKIFERNCARQHRTLLLAETYAMMKTNAFNLFLNNYDNDNLYELMQKEESNLQLLMNESRFRTLMMQALTLIKNESRMPPKTVLEEYRKLEGSPLLQEAGKAKTLRSRLIYLSLMSIISFKLHDNEGALHSASAYLQLLEKNKHLLKRNTFYYLVGLRNKLIALTELKRVREVKAVLAKLKKAECQNTNQEILRFRTYYTFALLQYANRGDFSAAAKLIPEITNGLEKFGERIDIHSSLKLRLLMAEILFSRKEIDKAVNLLNGILGEPKIKDFGSIRIVAKTNLLMCHLELGNMRLLPSFAQSIMRLMKKEGLESTFEFSFVKIFREKTIRPEIFQQLQCDLEEAIGAGKQPVLFDYEKLKAYLKLKTS